MKKMMLAVLISAAAFAARADVITNTVVIVSNFYNQAFIETVVTQKVKSSHTDYYFTNHVNTITHDTLIVSQTNLSVNVDVGRDFVIAASNQANRAASAVNDSRTYANASAGSASSAASSASAASSSASSAAATRSAAASECASALATINARINWFDQHSGETITQINITSNNYYAVDSLARSAAAAADAAAKSNTASIVSLESRVGNNISTLQTNVGNLNGSVSGLETRIGSAEANVGNLNGSVSELETRIGSAEECIEAVSNMVDNVAVDRIVKYTNKNGLYVYDFYVNSVLRKRYSVDASSAADYRWDGIDYYNYNFTVQSFGGNQFPYIDYFRMVKSTGGFKLRVMASNSTWTEIDIPATNPVDKNVLPSVGVSSFGAGSYSCGLIFVSATRSVESYVSSDLNIYDSAGAVIGSLSKKSDVDSLRSFAYSLFNSTRIYSPDHGKFISGDLCVYNALYDTQSASVPMSFVGSDGTVLTRIGRQTVLGSVYYYYLSSEDVDAQLVTGSNVMPHYNKGMIISYVSASSNWRVVKLTNNDGGYSKLVNSLTGGFVLKSGTDGHDVTWVDSDDVFIYARGSKIGTLQIQ